MSEETMFLDETGRMIRMGDVVRAACINQHVHGEWVDYTVEKAPGGYKLSYLRAEKGQTLPVGYTGGYMADSLPEDVEFSLKEMVFTQVPLQVQGWQIVEPSA